MAKPIKPTPVLKGADAQKFFIKIKNKERNAEQNGKISIIKRDADLLRSILKN
jgi:hypothetical protein